MMNEKDFIKKKEKLVAHSKNGKCIDCVSFKYTNNDVKKSECKSMTNYVTQNALINAYCEKFIRHTNLIPVFCDYCGELLIREKDGDIGDDLRPIAWLSVYCPKISDIECDESISAEISENESQRHFSANF